MSDIPVQESIFIIWSSRDPEVADNIAFMYAHNSRLRGWWKRVRLIIWGPSAKLASENEHIQQRIREMLEDDVEVWACRACAENYDVVAPLEALGVNVVYVGETVTNMIKSGWKQLAV